MELNEIYDNLTYLHGEIRKSNNLIISAGKRIQAVLYNLEIVSEHIPEGRVINPITEELQLILKEMNTNINNLVGDHRNELVLVMKELEKLSKKEE